MITKSLAVSQVAVSSPPEGTAYPAALAKTEPQVLTVESLTHDSFTRLVDGSALAVRAPFYDPQSARRIGRWIDRSTALKIMKLIPTPGNRDETPTETYRRARSSSRSMGINRDHLEGSKREELPTADAVESAVAENAALRQFAGDRDPAVRLVNALREAYPPGAQFLTLEGREMVYGAGGTIFGPFGGSTPHVDLPAVVGQRQFSAVIYFRLPKQGGELKIWHQEEVYYLSRDEQESQPATLIQPSTGDLILFDTMRLHAVMSFMKGFRISTRIFIGFEPGKPLELYNP